MASDVNTADHEILCRCDTCELEGKCHVLWLLDGKETEEWNGTVCDCEFIQGNWNCKLNPF